MKIIIYILFFITSVIFSSSPVSSSPDFSIKERYDSGAVIEFHIGEILIDDKDGYHIISSASKGRTQNIGQPELPTYTFNYAVSYDISYHITVQENDYIKKNYSFMTVCN